MRPAAILAAILAAALLTAAASASAQEATAGRQKAQACIVCHGANGLAVQPETPHLAGQPAAYLAAQLRAFRSGERRHEQMSLIAKMLSDDDIAAVSAWFASIRVSAQPPG